MRLGLSMHRINGMKIVEEQRRGTIGMRKLLGIMTKVKV